MVKADKQSQKERVAHKVCSKRDLSIGKAAKQSQKGKRCFKKKIISPMVDFCDTFNFLLLAL